MAGLMFNYIRCVLFILCLGSAITFPILIAWCFGAIKHLEETEQYVVHYLDGDSVVNGPCTKWYNPFRARTRREKQRISAEEYAWITDRLSNEIRLETGPGSFFLGAYEEISPGNRILLKKDQWVRLVDSVTGDERIVLGPGSVVPGLFESSPDMNEGEAKDAISVNPDMAVVVANRRDGTVKLHDTAGLFYPSPYEDVVEMRQVIRILPHEAMVVRDDNGRFILHLGAGESGTETGKAFFLKPFEKVVEMTWSRFSDPKEGGVQEVGTTTFTRIDLRMRKVFYQYNVRTNDNVALQVEGAIFWQILDPKKLIRVTSDPAGDVWYKARSALVAAVGRVSFESFMNNFNSLIQEAFSGQLEDGFYSDRGLEVSTIEVTKYSPTDEYTAAALQEIIEETTNRINNMQAQRSENDVKAAALLSNITYEMGRARLLETTSKNEKMMASQQGEAEGLQLAGSALAFVQGLNTTVDELDERVRLFKLHKELENQNTRTRHIASGTSSLFMTADDLNLHLRHTEL